MSEATARPETRRRADKHRLILDAAAPIFGDAGFARASVDAIAAAAGVSKPTVYSHFGSKEQLFRESVADSAQQQNADGMAVIQRLDVSTHGWERSLLQLGAKLVDCQRSPCAQYLARMLAAEAGRDPEIYRLVRERAADPMFEALAGRLAMLGNAGHLRIPDPGLAARQFVALIMAELPELTEHGAKPVSDARVRKAVSAGVDTFVAAHR